MIIKNITLNVSNNTTGVSPTLIIYEGDNGLLLNITLKNFKFKLSSIHQIDATFINKNTMNNYARPNIHFDKDTIHIEINKELLSTLGVGSHQVQLHLYDEYLNRISTPAFDIVCKKPIYLE